MIFYGVKSQHEYPRISALTGVTNHTWNCLIRGYFCEFIIYVNNRSPIGFKRIDSVI